MKILIAGATGMLGRSLAAHFAPAHEIVALAGDLTKPEGWKASVRDLAPDVIINAAAGTNVDACEKNPAAARAINADAVGSLADSARELGAQFVHISTDAVFDGKASVPYSEHSEPRPLHEYGRSKLEGESQALAYNGSLVLRTNIFGWRRRDPLSFGEWVLEGLRKQEPLTMFTDVFFTPLFTGDLARIIEQALSRRATGLFNAGSSDVRSKHDFAELTADAYGLSKTCIRAIKVAEKGLAAPRSPYMALDSSKLENLLERHFPTVQEGILAWKNSA